MNCFLQQLIPPLSSLLYRSQDYICSSAEREARGMVWIFPGIEGRSTLNMGVLRGLMDAGLDRSLAVVDWTTGKRINYLWHLWGQKRNREVAAALASQIVKYQDTHPGRPVHLIGHSGGGAMACYVLEALPADRRINAAFLIGPALSPQYPLHAALSHTQHGIWHYWSIFDAFFLGLGTSLFGNSDRRFGPAAGMVGFRHTQDTGASLPPLTQVCWTPRLMRSFNIGGHFSCTNRVFVQEHIATVIKATS